MLHNKEVEVVKFGQRKLKKGVWNSLIVHQVKTKKITTVKEVWIPDLNKHRFLRFDLSVYTLFFFFCFDWENISNIRDSVSSAIQTPRISSKTILQYQCCVCRFNISFSSALGAFLSASLPTATVHRNRFVSYWRWTQNQVNSSM